MSENRGKHIETTMEEGKEREVKNETEDSEPEDTKKDCGSKDEAKCEEVKSTAIVKYSLSKPARFMELQYNTDLNSPPSNWLSSLGDTYGFQHIMCHPKGFSSFRMAHMFPDCVGEVDVISDADNIKNLLRIPYCKGVISMMVHRVENTLLIDDFDIYKHLMKTSETDWQWLKKFIVEHINTETTESERSLYVKSRRREALKEKSLVSKFLYHSLGDAAGEEVNSAQGASPLHVEKPLLPEPSPSSEIPSSSTDFNHQFNRNVVWTFEDIEMLLGTDLPIFGGGTHPCISLRLRDMNKPINVLTGIDYWLDNLMSNVPEVVMCYHLNGIVQKYELIKTEDLPELTDSKFSPKLIRDVAQSILTFLKTNATKAGHTYWLFKGKNQDVVKLYDLSSLSSDNDVDSCQNPFTIPVAMLLYRVARNMKHSSQRHQPGTIRMLLKNCVKLLPEEKYPEIVTSSHYMLSDLYIPANTNPESPDLEEQMECDDNESVYDDDLGDDNGSIDDVEATTKVLLLNSNCYSFEKPKKNYKQPPPISGSPIERATQAISHVAAGLSCLKFFPEVKTSEEEEVKMAKPAEPIPMPYSRLNEDDLAANNKESIKRSVKKSKEKKKKAGKQCEIRERDTTNALLLKNKNEPQRLPTWGGTDINNISWKDHLKILLYEKAILTYAVLAERYYQTRNYGSGLRALGHLARCQNIMNRFNSNPSDIREHCLLGRAGDCAVMIAKNWDRSETYKNQYHFCSEEDGKMVEQLELDEQHFKINLGHSNLRCVFLSDIRSPGQVLLSGIECYKEAIKISPDNRDMLQRLGNSYNEMSSVFLNEAKSTREKETIISTCTKSEPYLKSGLEIFQLIKDVPNEALLQANMGHLNRLMAYAHAPEERSELTSIERSYYNKAFASYKKALQVLGDRKSCVGIWDAVNWDLSTTFYNMGNIMLDNPPSTMSKAEAEKEVIEVLQKALKYCDLNEENPKFPLYQFRAAVIHRRIGSLYHNHLYTINDNPSRRKNIIQLARINYEKSSKLFFKTMDAVNYLRTQMERFGLLENLSNLTNIPKLKITYLQECIEILIEIDDMIKAISEKSVEVPPEELQKSSPEASGCATKFDNIPDLVLLVKKRLQCVLLSLNQLLLQKPSQVKDGPKLLQLYRKCYQISFSLKEDLELEEFVALLHSVLAEIKEEITNFKSETL